MFADHHKHRKHQRSVATVTVGGTDYKTNHLTVAQLQMLALCRANSFMDVNKTAFEKAGEAETEVESDF